MTILRCLIVFGAALLLAIPARARAGDECDDKPEAPAPSSRALADGAFLPLTLSPRVGRTAALAFGSGGYDSARKSRMADVAAEVRLWGPVALRGGATYSGDQQRMRPSVGGRVQILRQDAHGLDGALSVSYKAEGFTEPEGEIETVVAVGRTFGRNTVLGNLAYGQDPEGNERDGELRVAGFRQSGRVVLGIDARARAALGTQHGKAAAIEPKLDVLAGPVAMIAVAGFVAFAEVGPTILRLADSSTATGISAFAGLGSAF